MKEQKKKNEEEEGKELVKMRRGRRRRREGWRVKVKEEIFNNGNNVISVYEFSLLRSLINPGMVKCANRE